MTKTSSLFGHLSTNNTNADFDLWFTYRRDSAATTMPMPVYLRHVDGSNHLLLEIQSAQARIYQKVTPLVCGNCVHAALWSTLESGIYVDGQKRGASQDEQR